MQGVCVQMRKDYHTHPTVFAAPERFEQYVQQAERNRVHALCVTDHMPLSASRDGDRIPVGHVKEYCAIVRKLAEKYEDRLRVLCGIEMDYHPSVLGEIKAVLEAGEFDCILASSHMHVFVQDFDRYSYSDFAAMALENSLGAVETGWFQIVTHLDMYRFAFENPHRFPLRPDLYDPENHKDLIRELLLSIKNKNMYLEINPHLAESKGDPRFLYPQEQITRWALEAGVCFSYGSDAHTPGSVGAWMDLLEAHPVYGPAMKQWEAKA